MPMQGERRSVQARPTADLTVTSARPSWFFATVTDRDFQIVVAFSLIGLLATVDLALRFADYGKMLAQLL